MTNAKSGNVLENKNHTYWLRRKSLISYPGLAILLLGLVNCMWTFHGFKLFMAGFSNYLSCPSFLPLVMGGNILLTGVIAFPIMWIVFWMVFIKGFSAIVGAISPPILIWIKKKRAGL
mmetsp:Transcript_37421/g.33541  ORF Transcript_37421/g.33541 Transcript_37421/m.33541 type:complete len:118 (-) Transcript_37421:295-648(-)